MTWSVLRGDWPLPQTRGTAQAHQVRWSTLGNRSDSERAQIPTIRATPMVWANSSHLEACLLRWVKVTRRMVRLHLLVLMARAKVKASPSELAPSRRDQLIHGWHRLRARIRLRLRVLETCIRNTRVKRFKHQEFKRGTELSEWARHSQSRGVTCLSWRRC